ncbi:MAG: VOC family protein [Myxococcota bacterium]
MQEDRRPAAAAGHLFLTIPEDVASASRRLVAVGVRPIAVQDAFAVLELRGGSHIVVRAGDVPRPAPAPFDLMYDDIEAARSTFIEEGFEVTPIQDGRIHRSFRAIAPEGFEIQVVDSHAGDRTV